MTNAQYGHPRLVALYDELNPAGPDTDFWLRLAGETPLRILDLGCGTGLLTTLLAARGHTVTGVDPAPAMLDIARTRAGGDKVRWLEGDARTLSLGETFDLILMTGHVFQVFLTDEDVHAVLSNAKRHLVPGGRLAFDTRNPATRPWERWTPDASRRRFTGGECAHEVTAVDGEEITFDTHYRFDDGMMLTTRSRLRFLKQEQFTDRLASAGLEEVACLEDWLGSSSTLTSAEIIVVAQ